MSKTVNFSVRGAENVLQKMQAVSYDVRYKGGRASLRKAAVELAGIVRQNSREIDDPTTPRSIPANVAVRFNRKQFDASGRVGFRVGILGGAGGSFTSADLAGNPGGDTRYWRQFEFGNSKMPAKPFMRRALADNINKLTGIFATEYSKALSRAIKKASKNSNA